MVWAGGDPGHQLTTICRIAVFDGSALMMGRLSLLFNSIIYEKLIYVLIWKKFRKYKKWNFSNDGLINYNIDLIYHLFDLSSNKQIIWLNEILFEIYWLQIKGFVFLEQILIPCLQNRKNWKKSLFFKHLKHFQHLIRTKGSDCHLIVI